MGKGEQWRERQQPCGVCAKDANEEGSKNSAEKWQTQGRECQSRDTGHVPSPAGNELRGAGESRKSRQVYENSSAVTSLVRLGSNLRVGSRIAVSEENGFHCRRVQPLSGLPCLAMKRDLRSRLIQYAAIPHHIAVEKSKPSPRRERSRPWPIRQSPKFKRPMRNGRNS